MKIVPTNGAWHLFTRFLIFSTVFLCIVWMVTSCDKDMVPQDTGLQSPTLSIEEAKQFLASKIPLRSTSLRDDSEESESKPIEPAWEKAISYYDEAKKQSVVEVALFDPRFSKILYNPDNIPVDTVDFLQTQQNNRLIIVKDSANVVDYAIMKIDGKYQNNLGAGMPDSNSYQKMNSDFHGFVSYVDMNDQVKSSYYIFGGQHALIQSSKPDSTKPNELQERWEVICIRIYQFTSCTCAPHHAIEDQGSCHCVSHGGQGPSVISYLECYDTGTLVNGGTTFTPTSGSGWGNGGGTPGNPSSGLPPWPYQSCVADRSSILYNMYGIDLLTDYEELANECANQVFTQEDFTNCVIDKFGEGYEYITPPERIIEFPSAIDNCFLTPTQCPDCTLTADLFIEQPVPGTRNLHGGEGGYKNTGHTFMRLSQYNSNGELEKRLTFGHYPFKYPHGEGVVGGAFFEENNRTVYNIKVTYPITYTQLEQMKVALSNYEMTYQAAYNNCTTRMEYVFGQAGIPLPDCPDRHQWPFGDILSNPGDMGEEIREVYDPANLPPYNGVLFTTESPIHLTPEVIIKCD